VDPDDQSLKKERRYWRDLEHRIWKAVDVIYYLSVNEQQHVQQWLENNGGQARVRTLPCFAFDSFNQNPGQGLHERSNILFVAGFGHWPNVDGALWFVKNVLPVVQLQFPNILLYLVGSNPSEEIKSLNSSRVIVTGSVSEEQLSDYYAGARVVVAPLRFGAGVKGKVVEAMRFGVPVVTTSIGLQGLENAADGIYATDSPDMFGEYVLRLLQDDIEWRRCADILVAFAKLHFSVPAMHHAIADDFRLQDNASPEDTGVRVSGAR
jgi:glycosyltransferase involved in cell wall biosynthesis